MSFTKSYEPGEFEPNIYALWEQTGAFQPKKVVVDSDETDTDNCYSIVMPPPNANGNLHIGHGLTIALEDSLTRYYRLRGKSTWYIPGADHAGFETWVVYERALEKEGHTRFEFGRDELYARVWDFVEQQRGNMELQVRALGASCAWPDLTFTLDENVVSRVYSTFKKMWDDGMIYRGEKLVNFCPHHQTAFADIEVEHKDEDGHLWEIAYPIIGADVSDSLTEIIVSTTRPETIFGDVAVAVNPEDERYTDYIGRELQLPLTNRTIPIIADEHADPAYGTGAVKITPAHDFDDFEVGERHNLARIQVISEGGLMLETAGPTYAGLSTTDCRKQVLKDLEDQGLLRGEKKITHSVAHCYKCDTVIEPMLKSQWFIDVKRLAAEAIKHLENNEIKFHPTNKKKVLINYLQNLKDWNISRQIPWGIAIPMFHQTETDEAPEWIFDPRTNLEKIEVGGVHYYRDEDTFDTWFSSSHWPIVCTNWLEGKENPYYPLNVMETGADILFAWVARMIMMGIYVTGEVPFREVYLHGLVLDAHGQKMSKSKGNVINPIELVTKYGSDAFRLGILRGRSAGMNQAFSENSVISGRNLCNKLWNVARFIQSMVDESHTDSLTALEIAANELDSTIVTKLLFKPVVNFPTRLITSAKTGFAASLPPPRNRSKTISPIIASPKPLKLSILSFGTNTPTGLSRAKRSTRIFPYSKLLSKQFSRCSIRSHLSSLRRSGKVLVGLKASLLSNLGHLVSSSTRFLLNNSKILSLSFPKFVPPCNVYLRLPKAKNGVSSSTTIPWSTTINS